MAGEGSTSQAEHHPINMTVRPPTTIVGILRRLGPGLIIAGSIVGSGELIATTLTGAQAGFWLLWLIIIGCVIKVFVQVELGRYTIINGKTTMTGLDEVPGPRIRGRGNWLVWYWLAMFMVGLGQLGGIVGGVGQALAISVPLTEEGRLYNQIVDAQMGLKVKESELKGELARDASPGTAQVERNRLEIKQMKSRIEELGTPPDANKVKDQFLWAAIVTVITAIVLVNGRYGLIQSLATGLVGTFTAITIVNFVMLQSQATWAVTWNDIVNGLSFRLTPKEEALGNSPLTTALATFGIIGVGAAELITYPYWCLEKGYARFTGPRDDSAEWAERANGWMRVMRWDAWCSMIVYTFATIAFYLLGAAILGRIQLLPQKAEMIRTLAVMYEPVFGAAAQVLFLFGAFAVLYSTFFVASAGHARVFPDALRVFGIGPNTDEAYRKAIRFFSGLIPFVCLSVYFIFPEPTTLVLAGGAMQAVMLPMVAAAAIYFRYRRCDARLTPSRVWDAMLWISAFGMLLAGGWLAITKAPEFAVLFLSAIRDLFTSSGV